MKTEEIVHQAKRILKELESNIPGSFTQEKEFFRIYGGKDNSFLDALKEFDKVSNYGMIKEATKYNLLSFINYVENNLLKFISLERETQIETVSDYMSQAEILLDDSKVHPAAPAVIIGASLEEFLRNWLEEEGEDFENINMNLDSFAKELRSRNLISKQDIKDISSWGGIRNDAAHGHWENVEDRKRIRLMLESVNLFIRKYQN